MQDMQSWNLEDPVSQVRKSHTRLLNTKEKRQGKKVLKIHRGGAKASVEIFHAGQDARTVELCKGTICTDPSGWG